MASWKLTKQTPTVKEKPSHRHLLCFKYTLITLCTPLFFLMSNNGIALSDEANLDRYILAAKRYIESKQFERAESYLTKTGTLEIEPPAEYYFLLGQVHAHKSELDKARAAYEAYVNKVGREGELYTVALERITDLEELMLSRETLKQPQNQLKESAIKASDPNTQDQVYLTQIKGLYLTDSAEEALVKHINSIFGIAPYTGATIQRGDQKSLSYKLSVNSENDIIITQHDHRQKPTEITTDKVDVYGQDPYINYECDRQSFSCWLKKPSNFGKWVQITYDEKAANNLSKSMTLLFKTLQEKN